MPRPIDTLDPTQVVARMRRQGYTLREIADAIGISEAVVWRIAKRAKVAAPRELRGGWRRGKKGATPAQVIAHARPASVVPLLRRYGHLNAVAEIVTEQKRRFWQVGA